MPKLVKLFEPGRIGKMEVRNRTVMAAMGAGYARDPGGYVTQRFTDYYVARAKGGVGLIITGLAMVVPENPVFPGCFGIYADGLVPGLAQMARAVQAHGARIAIQLYHPGRRLAEFRPGLPSVSASPVPHFMDGNVPHELSKAEIKRIVEAYGDGGRRARDAGYDGVEIHGAHGFLPNQFLSPWTNKRTDEYGGSIENRVRFACEMMQNIKSKAGLDFPIIFRMDGDDGIEGGITIEEACRQAPYLVEAGADALHVSCGIREGHHRQFITRVQPSGMLIPLAAAIKKVVKVPVIAVGKIGDPVLGEQALAQGKADFIAMGRPLLADPELPKKAQEGRLGDIRPCIFCNWGCLQLRLHSHHMVSLCSVNPACGSEAEYRLEPAARPKKVMVVGGGLAGMEAARTLAQRGHRVSLYEASDRLGGQWNLAAACSPEVANLTRYLKKGIKDAGVKVTMSRKVDRKLIEAEKPDAVVIATGARQRIPQAEGVNGANVVLANDVLSGKAKVGQEVVIIGGRLVGMDTACFLAAQGKKVSVASKGQIARDVPSTLKLALKEKLIGLGGRMYPFAKLHSITPKGVNLVCDREILFLKADTVVLAIGSEAENSLVEEIKGTVPELHAIGDCVEPRNVFSAIHEGSRVGRTI